MDDQKSPSDDHSSSDSTPTLHPPHSPSPEDMAAAVASMPTSFPPPPPPDSSPGPPPQLAPGTNKRYRPAPAKTFQCRGYGECRMVFSRSEHLARHIRKHTGERPFTCHCSKQFSRLDNLRQHAQTVHADKQEQNERMMHELTSLHATMTAASKGGQPRGKRAQAAAAAAASQAGSSTLDGTLPSMSIKQEDSVIGIPTMHQRPGTSTGYEGGNGMMYHPGATWQIQTSNVDRPSLRPTNNHSFRDPGQSFRAFPNTSASSPTSSTAPASYHQQSLQQHSGQSFLVPSSSTFNFSLPDIPNNSSSNLRPGSSSGPRPPSADANRSLPPISAVVSSSLASTFPLPHGPPHPPFVFAQQHQHQHQQRGSSPSSTPLTSSHILPLPTPSYIGGLRGRRPSTATRPGTAPASFYYSGATTPNGFSSGSAAMVSQHRPELSLSFLSGHGRYGNIGGGSGPLLRSTSGSINVDAGGDEPTSPTGGTYDSPFSFHAPSTSSSAATSSTSFADNSVNPRKRPHPGSDDDERVRGDVLRPISSSGRRPGTGYDYGTESRPQSRRLSVMELCNDTDADPTTRPIIPLSATAAASAAGVSRPTTSSGLVTSASQLAIVDRPTPPPSSSAVPGGNLRTPSPERERIRIRTSPSLLSRTSSSTTGTAPASASPATTSPATTAGAGATGIRGGGGSFSTWGARTTEFGGGIPASSVQPAAAAATQRNVSPPQQQQQQSAYYPFYQPAQSSPRSSASGGSPVLPNRSYATTTSSAATYSQSGWGRSGGVSSSSPTPHYGDVGSPSGSTTSSSSSSTSVSVGGRTPGPGGPSGGGGGSGSSGGGGESRGNDQVRIPTAVGMRA